MEPTVLNKAEAGAKASRSPLAQLMYLKGRVADQLNKMEKTLESGNPISTTEMRARIKDLDDAWFKFLDQHNKLHIISRRGRLFGLEAYYSDLSMWWLGHSSGW